MGYTVFVFRDGVSLMISSRKWTRHTQRHAWFWRLFRSELYVDLYAVTRGTELFTNRLPRSHHPIVQFGLLPPPPLAEEAWTLVVVTLHMHC
jgi:hypothetical protein